MQLRITNSQTGLEVIIMIYALMTPGTISLYIAEKYIATTTNKPSSAGSTLKALFFVDFHPFS